VGFRPNIGEFPRDEYARSIWNPAWHGYSVSRAFVHSSRDWIIFSVQSTFEDHKLSCVVGIGAYHLPSGALRHFSFSPPSRNTGWKMMIDDQLGFVPLDRNCFLIPCILSVSNVPASGEPKAASGMDTENRLGQSQHKSQFWEWDLAEGKARLWGRSDKIPVRVARAVRLERCGLCARSLSNSDAMAAIVGVRDRLSGKSVEVELKLACRALSTASQTYAATGDPCAFAVCNAWDLESDGKLDVFCVDPDAQRGVRWRRESGRWGQLVGEKLTGAAFLDNSWDSSLGIFLMLMTENKKESASHVFLAKIGSAAGSIENQYRLPLPSRCWEPEDFAVSPSKRVVIARMENVDNSDNSVFVRFRIIDLSSSKFRDTARLGGELAFCRLCGFVNETEVVLAGDSTIYLLDTKEGMRVKELLRLGQRKGNGNGSQKQGIKTTGLKMVHAPVKPTRSSE
jgi:hypothetical protein